LGSLTKGKVKRLSKELLVGGERLRKRFYVLSHEMKAGAGQSSISMLNVVKEIGIVFRRSVP